MTTPKTLEELKEEARVIENPSVEQLHEMLSRIGFAVKGRYPNSWIFDYEGHKTMYRVSSDRIEYDDRYSHYVTCFYFNDSKIELLEDNDAVSISPKGRENAAFVLFMNHTLTRKEQFLSSVKKEA